MMTRSRFYRLALDANEQRANVRDVDVLPIPTLDERATLYLRAVHGNRDFTEEERSNARNVLLDSMAAEIAAQVIPAEQSPVGEHGADRGSLLAQYAAQYWQSVQRKEAIKIAPIAKRRTSILALTATFGLVLIVTGGTLGYRWTYPHTLGLDEVTAPTQEARLPEVDIRTYVGAPPTTSPRSLSTPAQQVGMPPLPTSPGSLSTRPFPSEQHVVKIASRRSEAEVLAFFSYLQQEQPTLFGQAILKRIDPPLGAERVQNRPGLQS